jgi:hypothetical protein
MYFWLHSKTINYVMIIIFWEMIIIIVTAVETSNITINYVFKRKYATQN